LSVNGRCGQAQRNEPHQRKGRQMMHGHTMKVAGKFLPSGLGNYRRTNCNAEPSWKTSTGNIRNVIFAGDANLRMPRLDVPQRSMASGLHGLPDTFQKRMQNLRRRRVRLRAPDATLGKTEAHEPNVAAWRSRIRGLESSRDAARPLCCEVPPAQRGSNRTGVDGLVPRAFELDPTGRLDPVLIDGYLDPRGHRACMGTFDSLLADRTGQGKGATRSA
jgi:hypothetical protein